VIAALLLAALLLPAPDGYSVDAPHDALQLGQRFEIVVRGPLAKGDELVTGALPDGLLGEQPKQVESAGDPLRWPLRAVREGQFTLAGLAVRHEGEARPLADVHLDVKLDVRAGGPPEVAAPLPPVRVPYAPVPRRPVAALLAAALLLLGVLVARAGRVVVVPPPPPRPAELVAAEALARLRGRLPRSHEEVPAFVVEVSGVLRAYIEGRFGLHAPESTTEEFLPAATAHPALAGHRDTLARFLTGCDLVKFARHRPEPSSMGELLATAEGFVEATRA
jgi:hypothetical protein